MKRVMFMSTVLLIIFAMTTMFSIAGCKAEVAAEEVAAEEVAAEEAAVPTAGYYSSEKETYYMVTFVNGHPYWVGCLKGAQAAAANLGNVEVKFGGTPEYDINEAVTSFEQIVAIKPEGILLACMNPEPFIEPINNAMADGIPIVTYDTDSPNSNRLAYASTDNVYLGEQVFDYIVNEVMGSEQFKIGIMCRPGQLNLEQRIEGFKKRAVNYPGVEIVAEVDGEGDILKSATAASAMIAANPDIGIIWSTDGMGGPGAAQACEELGREDIKIMCVDSSDDILEMIKAGKIYATVAQNTYNQGYWAMMLMYSYTHNLVEPFTDWKEREGMGGSPLPPYINTGMDFLTAENCEYFSVE